MHLKPGGRLAAWVYGAEGNFVVARLFNPLRLAVTSRLPLRAVYAASWAMAAFAYPALKGVFAPLQRRPGARRRLGFIPYLEYACYLSDFGLNQIHSIVFDHLSPPISHYLRRVDVEAWCAGAGLSETSVAWHKRYSWRVQGRRPTLAPELGAQTPATGEASASPVAGPVGARPALGNAAAG